MGDAVRDTTPSQPGVRSSDLVFNEFDSSSYLAAYQSPPAEDPATVAAIVHASSEFSYNWASAGSFPAPVMPATQQLTPTASQPPARVPYAGRHNASAHPKFHDATNNMMRAQNHPQMASMAPSYELAPCPQ